MYEYWESFFAWFNKLPEVTSKWGRAPITKEILAVRTEEQENLSDEAAKKLFRDISSELYALGLWGFNNADLTNFREKQQE